jgi:hypothetical protein
MLFGPECDKESLGRAPRRVIEVKSVMLQFRSHRLGLVALGALLVGGCGFHPASSDGGSDTDMGANGGGGGAGGGGTGGGAGGGGGGGDGGAPDDCTTPTLLVLLRNANQSSIGGQVFQLSLATSPPQKCGITIKNTIVDLPFAVAWIAPSSIAVGMDSSAVLIDAATDQYRWNKTTGRVADVFPIMSPQGLAVGVATYDTSFSEIGEVQVFDQPMGKSLGDWTMNSNPFLLGLSVVGMTQSPLDPTHVFAIKPIDYQAADAPVPFDNQPINKTIYYMQAPPSGGFTSIASVRAVGNVIRTAWVDSSTDSSPDSAYYVNDTGSGPILAGPLSCAATVCGTPFRITAVVPDPTDTTHVIGICQAASTSTIAHVVRFAATGTCEVLFDGTSLPSLVFPVRVALRMN